MPPSESELGQDELYTMAEAWNDIDTFFRERNQNIGDYVSEFDTRWRLAENAGIGQISSKCRALIILSRSGATKDQRNNIMSHVDGIEDGDRFYKMVCKHLKTQLGGGPPESQRGHSGGSTAKTCIQKITAEEAENQDLFTEAGKTDVH